MKYFLWANCDNPEFLEQSSGNPTMGLGYTHTWAEAQQFKRRLELWNPGQMIWICDAHGDEIPEFGSLKDDYRLEYIHRGPGKLRILIQREAVPVFTDGTRAQDVETVRVTVFCQDIEDAPDEEDTTEYIMRRLPEIYPKALID